VALNLFACFNQKSNVNETLLGGDSSSTNLKIDSARKKIDLIETVLNLPTVIKLSKIEFIRREYGENLYPFRGC
jgi:hypothetical protein